MHRQPVQLLVKINYPTHATRPIVKSNGSESLGASSFDAEPTMTEFENNTSVLVAVFDSLPTGATSIAVSEATLVESEVPSEFSERLVNGMVWREPLDKWMKHYPYLNATVTGSEPEILAGRQINDYHAWAADARLAPKPPYLINNRNNLHNSGLELTLRAKKITFNLKSDYLMEDRELNGQVTHHAIMGDNIGVVVATKVLTDGIPSYYPCTEPTLDPEDRFYVHPVAFSCDKHVSDIDSNIFTKMPKSWRENSSFDSVGWYRPYVDKQRLFDNLYAETYQSRERTRSDAMITGLGFAKMSLKWEANLVQVAEIEVLQVLSLALVPDKLEYHTKEETDDKDVRHSRHHCGHSYDCNQMILCGWNEIMPKREIPSPSKPYDVEGEIITRNLMKYQLRNVRDVLSKKIERVLTASACLTGPGPSDGPAVDSTPKEMDKRFRVKITRADVDIYEVCGRVSGLEDQIHIARLRWKAFYVGKWDTEDRIYSCGLQVSCPWKDAQHGIRKRKWSDILTEYALRSYASTSASAVLLHLSAPLPDVLIDCTELESRIVVTSDWLDLLAHLVITDEYRRRSVVLPRSRIKNPPLAFNRIDRNSEQFTAMDGLTSSAVAPLTTQPPYMESEEPTTYLELRKVQVDHRSRYPYLQQNAVQENGNRVNRQVIELSQIV